MIFLHLFLTMGSAIQNLQLLQIYSMIFFHSAAPVIQSKIKFSCKSFNEYLPSKNYDSFTTTPTSKAETDAIISSLNSNKSTGPISIPLKILKLKIKYVNT